MIAEEEIGYNTMEKPGKVKLLKPLKLGADKSENQQE